jgi:hypothetical protein
MLTSIMLKMIMLNDILLNVILLNVILLNVMAPFKQRLLAVFLQKTELKNLNFCE